MAKQIVPHFSFAPQREIPPNTSKYFTLLKLHSCWLNTWDPGSFTGWGWTAEEWPWCRRAHCRWVRGRGPNPTTHTLAGKIQEYKTKIQKYKIQKLKNTKYRMVCTGKSEGAAYKPTTHTHIHRAKYKNTKLKLKYKNHKLQNGMCWWVRGRSPNPT